MSVHLGLFAQPGYPSVIEAAPLKLAGRKPTATTLIMTVEVDGPPLAAYSEHPGGGYNAYVHGRIHHPHLLH